MWATILLYILIVLVFEGNLAFGFFFGLILPLMSISKAFRETYKKWVDEEGYHNSSWDEGAAWFEKTFYRIFYGGKK